MTVGRTCVGCGARDEKRDMRRFVRVGDRLELDPWQRRPGRGAYVHAAPDCLDALRSRRGAIRSLRWTPTATDRARVASQVMVVTRAR